jgi:hypothetical protein
MLQRISRPERGRISLYGLGGSGMTSVFGELTRRNVAELDNGSEQKFVLKEYANPDHLISKPIYSVRE